MLISDGAFEKRLSGQKLSPNGNGFSLRLDEKNTIGINPAAFDSSRTHHLAEHPPSPTPPRKNPTSSSNTGIGVVGGHVGRGLGPARLPRHEAAGARPLHGAPGDNASPKDPQENVTPHIRNLQLH